MRLLLVSALVAASALVGVNLDPARAAPNADGNLGTGGTAKGDISTTSGETDTIGIDLVAGSRVNFRFSAGFDAVVGFFDTGGAQVPIDLQTKNPAVVRAWLVPATGRYEFRVASADGSQGFYTLSAKPYWDKTMVLDGSQSEPAFDVPMPAAGRLKGTVRPLPGASNPSILSFLSPEGTELLVHPIVGTAGLAKFPSTDCPTQGSYRLTAQAAAGTMTFRATLKRTAPRVPLTTQNLVNGLDPVSFATSGLSTYFRKNCYSCHSWSGSFAGVRAYGKSSLGRMITGSMPKNGPRADAATISLLKSWIVSGYGK